MTATAAINTAKGPFGPLICEGKTKQIYEVKDRPRLVLVVSKNDITAGDGAKHDLIPGKAEWSTQTTSNVFKLLKSMGLPVAFVDQYRKTSFYATKCHMLPYEVVVRREAHGSFLKRNPEVEKGHRFPELIGELYLKTKDRTWKGTSLLCDDPLIQFGMDGEIRLHDPAVPIAAPFLELHESSVFSYKNEHELLAEMSEIALRAFSILETAWAGQGGRLVDFKVEFGVGPDGQLLLADVIDNDSWRVIMDGGYVDKQIYRDGGTLDEMATKLASVAQLTSRFRRPRV